MALAVAEPENASKGQDPASSSMGEGFACKRLSLSHTRISSVSLGCCEMVQRPKSYYPKNRGDGRLNDDEELLVIRWRVPSRLSFRAMELRRIMVAKTSFADGCAR